MKQKGQMLIEIVVAVGVLALVLIGMSDLMTRSSRVLTYQKDREGAYSVARTILAEYRKDRDANPVTFFTTVSGLTRDVCIEGQKYACRVEVVDLVGGVSLNIRVYWTEGTNRFEVSLDQVLTEI